MIWRGADVYRLFCQAFHPGREQLALTLKRAGAFRTYAAQDPESGDLWIFSVNPATRSQAVNLDVFPWAQTLAGAAVVSEVSEAKGGEVVAVRMLDKGRLSGLKQPAESVWLIHLPGSSAPAKWVDVPVDADTMVADGIHYKTSHGNKEQIRVVNDVKDASGRNAGLFRFQMPDIPAERILAAVVEFPARLTDERQSASQVQVFVSDQVDWSETELSWSSAVATS